MQTSTKVIILMVFQTIILLFWKVAGLCAFYFVIVALFFSGRWSPFFWAAGLSIVGKWLGGGLL